MDDRDTPASVKVFDLELAALAIERDEFQDKWNYRLKPRDLGG